MKHFKRHTRRQLFLIGCAIALLGTVAILPWRVVAQEAKTAAAADAEVESSAIAGRANPLAAPPAADGAADDAAEKPVVQAWGSFKGRFIYDGEAPVPQQIQINKDPQAFGGVVLFDESLAVATDNSLMNVVVWLRTKNVPIHPDYEANRDQPVVVQAKDARYDPHIIAYRTGRPLELKNLDAVAHNMNVPCVNNNPFNLIIPSGGSALLPPLKSAETIPVQLSDNIHAWMISWLIVQPHPYVAVSAKDGRFEIKNLPAGVPLEFQVWQERSGYVQKAEIDGTDVGWKKGRFTTTIRPGENELGDIKLDPQQFNR